MTNEQRIIKVEENKNIIRKREYKMTTVKKNDFERTEGGDVVRGRNRGKSIERGKIKTNIRKIIM